MGQKYRILSVNLFYESLVYSTKIIELSSIDSTNSYLVNLSQKIEIEEGTIVIAYEQTKGKGQRENFGRQNIVSHCVLAYCLGLA